MSRLYHEVTETENRFGYYMTECITESDLSDQDEETDYYAEADEQFYNNPFIEFEAEC